MANEYCADAVRVCVTSRLQGAGSRFCSLWGGQCSERGMKANAWEKTRHSVHREAVSRVRVAGQGVRSAC
ncbi:hypothetical protein MHYP_G00067210 [Metynnis hypsauchen]